MFTFDNTFIFGTATSSYQIEGARYEGGRSDCIWDKFCEMPGKILNNDTGDVACDHYHKFQEDIDLMKKLGVESYRFSIAWSRIYPEQGRYNPKGMAFYKSIISKLNRSGIKPSVTLYHWDLPQWMEDKGGWANREVVEHFVTFSKTCFEELGNDVEFWITHNEPFCAGILGYMEGVHAPGIKDVATSLRAIHHILLSHGQVVNLFRKLDLTGEIGITLNHAPVVANSNSVEDKLAANNYDGWMNRWFLDPIFKKTYPLDMINLYHNQMGTLDFIHEGDMETIGVPIDFFGINYYHASKVKYNPNNPLLFEDVDLGVKKTAMGWPVVPAGLDTLISRIRNDYTELPIYITENGAAFDDVVEEDGSIRDKDRVEYIEDHIRTVAHMNQKGLNIAGYYLWSFMDNFEWAFGYDRRFGIVHIDFETLKRTPKSSFYRYQDIISKREI